MLAWISDNIWWIIAFFVILFFLLYLFIAAWRQRSGLRNAVHELLGDEFRENRSYATSKFALALDEKGRRFACVKGSQRAVMKGEDIVELIFREGTQYTPAWLTIVTNNEELPRIDLDHFNTGGRARLVELHSRLKRMREPLETRAEPQPKPLPSAEGERLERAIGQLTDAVSSLADAIRNASEKQVNLNSKNGGTNSACLTHTDSQSS